MIQDKYYFFIVMAFTFLIASPAVSQNTWEVTVSNYSFNPSELTIEQGDIVIWKNISGSHNVNGSIGTFSGNPVSFGNSVGSAPWEYSFTFTVSGEYQYQCDPHPSQMQGTISVSQATSIHTNTNTHEVKFYPVPFHNQLNISLPDNHTYLTLKLFSITGQEVNAIGVKDIETVHLEVGYLAKGLYIYQLSGTDNIVKMGKIQKH